MTARFMGGRVTWIPFPVEKGSSQETMPRHEIHARASSRTPRSPPQRFFPQNEFNEARRRLRPCAGRRRGSGKIGCGANAAHVPQIRICALFTSEIVTETASGFYLGVFGVIVPMVSMNHRIVDPVVGHLSSLWDANKTREGASQKVGNRKFVTSPLSSTPKQTI